MFIKPDYNLANIFEINLDELKSKGIKSMLFDLDSTLMASKTGCYDERTKKWLDNVKKDFFIGIISNNANKEYREKVLSCTDFPIVFEARKPSIKVAQKFMKEHGLVPETTCFVGDRPLTDIMCGKKLGCTTILVDSITADTEKPIVRFVRKLERISVR